MIMYVCTLSRSSPRVVNVCGLHKVCTHSKQREWCYCGVGRRSRIEMKVVGGSESTIYESNLKNNGIKTYFCKTIMRLFLSHHDAVIKRIPYQSLCYYLKLPTVLAFRRANCFCFYNAPYHQVK